MPASHSDGRDHFSGAAENSINHFRIRFNLWHISSCGSLSFGPGFPGRQGPSLILSSIPQTVARLQSPVPVIGRDDILVAAGGGKLASFEDLSDATAAFDGPRSLSEKCSARDSTLYKRGEKENRFKPRISRSRVQYFPFFLLPDKFCCNRREISDASSRGI